MTENRIVEQVKGMNASIQKKDEVWAKSFNRKNYSYHFGGVK